MKEIRRFLDDVVDHAKERKTRTRSGDARRLSRIPVSADPRRLSQVPASADYLQHCPETLGNAIRGCRRLTFFLEAKSTSNTSDGRVFAANASRLGLEEDHFDGSSATKSSDFLIDLEGSSMDQAPDVRPYLIFLGVWFSKRYLPLAYRDKSEGEKADYYVQKGKTLLLSCWKRGKGYFLSPRDGLLDIHRNSWRHGTMPWLYHAEAIGLGVSGAKMDQDVGFDESSDVGAGQIRMGEISVILTNLRMPVLPRRCLTITSISHTGEWDGMVLRNYDPRHHPAPPWRSTTFLTSMEVLYRSSNLFGQWTSPYHSRIMDKLESYIGDIKSLREQVNGLHPDYDIPGLGLRGLKELPLEQLATMEQGTSKPQGPEAVTNPGTSTQAPSSVIVPSSQLISIATLARSADFPALTLLDLPKTTMTTSDLDKFRFLRKDYKPSLDVNGYPGYPFPGYIHFDGLTPNKSEDFFIDLHGNRTDWEPDVRPYLLAVGRFALDEEMGGKLGKCTATNAERVDAIVQLGKDYLLWRWRKGDGTFMRPREGLLDVNKIESVRSMPWLYVAQQLAGQKKSRQSSQMGELGDLGFGLSTPKAALSMIQVPSGPATARAGSTAVNLILTNLRAPLLPRRNLTIDPYVNEPSWDQMVLTNYDVQIHPIGYWLRDHFQSVSEYRLATADELAEWTTTSFESEMETKKHELARKPKGSEVMRAIEEEYEMI